MCNEQDIYTAIKTVGIKTTLEAITRILSEQAEDIGDILYSSSDYSKALDILDAIAPKLNRLHLDLD